MQFGAPMAGGWRNGHGGHSVAGVVSRYRGQGGLGHQNHFSLAQPTFMTFLDTQAAAIERGPREGRWVRFRVRDPRQQLAMLRNICRCDRPLVLGAAQGPTLQVSLWSVDDMNGKLHFRVDDSTGLLEKIAAAPELWATTYLNDAKVQLGLHQVSVTDEGLQQVLVSAMPDRVYSMPRRGSVRVRRNDGGPKARFAHPLAPDLGTSMPILDVSEHGCALLRAADSLSLPLGMVLKKVEIELDNDTILYSDLLVQHVTIHSRSERSMRVGCEWRGMPQLAQDRLAEWIHLGRRRRTLMSLTLD
jgi:Flagellar regulator YcgR